MNTERLDALLDHDPVNWAVLKHGSRPEVAHIVTDGRMDMQTPVTVFKFIHAQLGYRPGIILHETLGRLGGVSRVKNTIFLVEEISSDDLPLKAYEVAGYNDEKGYVILLEARARMGSRKPWQRAYHLVIQ